MTIRDLHNNVRAKTAIIPVIMGATGTLTGLVIDRQGWGGVEFLVSYGSVTATGTSMVPVVFDGDVTGTLTSVADANLLGTELLASMVAATPRVAGVGKEVVKRVGYVGVKRYVRCDLLHTAVSHATAAVSAVAVLHSPALAPTANP